MYVDDLTASRKDDFTSTIEFEPWPKIPRLHRDIIITEKIDGTNAQVVIEGGRLVAVGSRKRWIAPGADNFGFAKWAYDHADALVMHLGDGRHYGEWWGQGIQRGYGLDHKRFSLFNSSRFNGLWEPMEDGTVLTVVPIIRYTQGQHLNAAVDFALDSLLVSGSYAAPGFPTPEGIVIYHPQGNLSFKVTLEKDEEHKGQ